MYESPIDKIYKDIQTQMIQQDEKMIMQAVREVGITVDKDELVKALQYDRNQYSKGYIDSKAETQEKIKNMLYDIYMAGVNMSGEYQGCWVRFKDIEEIVNKYISPN